MACRSKERTDSAKRSLYPRHLSFLANAALILGAAPICLGQITFAPAVPYPLPQVARSNQYGCAVAADFNGDGRPDVAVCAAGGIWIYMNKGDGTFLSPFPVGSPPVDGLAVLDLNLDGHPDLVAIVSARTVQTYVNQGFGTFVSSNTYTLPSTLFDSVHYPVFAGMLAGDFNGDGKRDVAIKDLNGGTVIYFGQGDGTLRQGTPFRTAVPAAPYGDFQFLSAVGDVNGDGMDDIVINTFDSGFQLFLGQRSGIIASPRTYPLSVSYPQYQLADVNGDGKLDLIGGNQYSAFFVMLNDGTGALGPPRNTLAGNFGGFLPLSIGDFNKDGSSDIVSAVNGSEYAFVNDGKGNFAGPTITNGFGTLYGGFNYYFFDMVADFDGDGLLDIATFSGSTLSAFKNTTIVTPVNVVTGFYPNNGGNTGQVSLSVIGNGFPANVQVTLVGPGGTIVPITTNVSLAGNLITASFDLTGTTPGVYTLVLKNAQGGVLYTQPAAFTVLQGGTSDIWVDLIGRNVLRAGQPQTYNVLVGNRGSIDSDSAGVWLRVPQFINISTAAGFEPAYSTTIGNYTLVLFDIVVPIPAGGNLSFPVSLKAPDDPKYAHAPFSIEISLQQE